MPAYYNEIDPYAAQWLRNLIAAGHIAPGDVDERSIVDVRADDLKGYSQCHFFAGIGGWSYALRLAGWGDERPVWTGSCPCQPFSLAGKQKGFADARHLWPIWRELIAERRPAKVFGEQVASASDWLGLVRGDLEALGYAVGCLPVQAASAGADHLRDRYWFVGDDQGERRGEGRPEHEVWERSWPAVASASGAGVANTDEPGASEERQQRSGQQRGAGGDPEARSSSRDLAYASGVGVSASTLEARGAMVVAKPGLSQHSGVGGGEFEWVIGADGKARRVKPGIRLLAHGVPARVGKLRGFGNAIDPRPAAAFIAATM